MKRAWPILVVDDEPEALRMLVEVLSEEGYIPKATTSGAEALELIRKQNFAVVLIDLVMSPVSGEEVIKAVKERSPSTEVIVVTAHPSLESTL